MLEQLLDGLLALAIVWLAWMVLSSADLFRAVILFIVFGLLMSLAWVRLAAPDIALAEAAIGAGLTGALLLDAVGQMEGQGGGGAEGRRRGGPAALAVLALAAVLFVTVWQLPRAPGKLTGVVAENLDRSGVEHPVTAVLLNFRGYDTWLEVGVLLLAVLATLIVRRAHDFSAVPVARLEDPVLGWVTRLLLPLLVLAGGYLLWLGTHAPGGAFQAGAVLAAAGVLLLLSGHPSITALRGAGLRALLAAGFAAFLLAAVGVMLTGRRFLEYPPEAAGTMILLVETAVTVSIAVTLVALFAGARPGASVQEAEG